MDNVACYGSESSLGQCHFNRWEIHNCGHGDDAGVVCLGKYVCMYVYLCALGTLLELEGWGGGGGETPDNGSKIISVYKTFQDQRWGVWEEGGLCL